MADKILIDTGAIIALIDRREQYHQWSKEQAAGYAPPFYTCEAVLSESFHLLESVNNGTDSLLGFLQQGLIQVSFSYLQHADAIQKTIKKYSDLPASFADACLVQMAETTRRTRVLTLDEHFNIYRTQTGKPLSLISPK